MKVLGDTGLVKVNDKDEWQQVKKLLLGGGCVERLLPNAITSEFVDPNGKIVTDYDSEGEQGRTVVNHFVELTALLSCGACLNHLSIGKLVVLDAVLGS